MMMALKRKRQLASQLTQRINEVKEDQLRIAVSEFFRKQCNLVLAAFDEYYMEEMLLQGHIDLILAPIHELQKEYYELLLEHNRDMFHRGEDQAERLVGKAQVNALKAKKKNVRITHDGDDKYTKHFGTLQFSEDYLESYTFTASETTMSRVDSEINQILTDGYREGWGVKEVRNRIMERYDQFSTWEANRIARTEMQTAHNMGMMNKYQDLGVEYHEWRAAHDKRTRRSHSKLDGEITAVGTPFSNDLMYPGDKTGPIEEWINCRCSHPPFLVPPGKMVPPGLKQFRESDLISVTEPNYGKLLQKETGGALNWQQYKQILHGKPLEQVLAGVTVAEAQQKKKEEPKQQPKTTPEEDIINNILADVMEEVGLGSQAPTRKTISPDVTISKNIQTTHKSNLWENLAEKNGFELVEATKTRVTFYDPKHNTPITFNIPKNEKWIDYTNRGLKKANIEDVLICYNSASTIQKQATPIIHIEGKSLDHGTVTIGRDVFKLELFEGAFYKTEGSINGGNLKGAMHHEMWHCVDIRMTPEQIARNNTGLNSNMKGSAYKQDVTKDRRAKKKTGGQHFCSEYARQSGSGNKVYEDFAEAGSVISSDTYLIISEKGEYVQMSKKEFIERYPNRAKHIQDIIDNGELLW